MQTFANDPALRLFALVSTLVAIHLLALAGLTGRARTKNKVYVNPEDAGAFKGKEVEADHPDVQRAKRAHMNALENAVPFFAVGLLYALSGPSMLGAQAYFWTFLGARVLHSVFYFAQKQPWRTIMFSVGALATFGMGVHVIRTVI
jgi:uncharacterized MAPEG superfamily protein